MYKLNKIHGFVALPILIGGAIIAAGLVGGLMYKYKNNQFISSVISKDKMLAQVGSGTCIDSDGGKNYETYGYVILSSPLFTKIHHSDSCTSKTLYETYCENNQIKTEAHFCPNGCNDGACLPAMNVISPNGGELYNPGDTIKIRWNPGYSSVVKISFSDGYSIVSDLDNSGSYDWAIPTDWPQSVYNWYASNNWTMPEDYFNKLKIRISEAGGGQLKVSEDDLSDMPFTISPTCILENFQASDENMNCCPGLIKKHIPLSCSPGMMCPTVMVFECVKAITSFTATDPASDTNQTSTINLSAFTNVNISITATCPSGMSLGMVDLDGKTTPADSSGENCFQLKQSYSSGTTFYIRPIGNIVTSTVNFTGTITDAGGNTLDTKTIPVTFGPSVTCTDSDGGKNYETYGYVIQSDTPNSQHSDSCTSKTLYETYCENNQIKTEAHFCPNGCNDGACLPAMNVISPDLPAIITPTCASFTYSNWESCQSNSTQTRNVMSSSPFGCTGGTPITTQPCVYSATQPTVPVNSGLSSTQIQAILNLLQVFGADESIINNVEYALTGVLAPSVVVPSVSDTASTVPSTDAQSSSIGTFSYTWNNDMYYGMTNNANVKALQQALTIEEVYSGPVNGNFWSLTRRAVIDFQNKHNFANIPGTGYVGLYTRKVLNELYSK